MAVILNVEDDSPSRFLKSRILERAGFEVVEAVTAADAIRTASEDGLRLVLLDLRLPDGDGFTVCERIKATRPSLPVVMITSTYATAQGRQDGLACGADAYLIEPVPAGSAPPFTARTPMAASWRVFVRVPLPTALKLSGS